MGTLLLFGRGEGWSSCLGWKLSISHVFLALFPAAVSAASPRQVCLNSGNVTQPTCSAGEVSLDAYCLWMGCIFNSWNHAPCILTGFSCTSTSECGGYSPRSASFPAVCCTAPLMLTTKGWCMSSGCLVPAHGWADGMRWIIRSFLSQNILWLMVSLFSQGLIAGVEWGMRFLLCCLLENVFKNTSAESQMKILLHQRTELWDSFIL